MSKNVELSNLWKSTQPPIFVAKNGGGFNGPFFFLDDLMKQNDEWSQFSKKMANSFNGPNANEKKGCSF